MAFLPSEGKSLIVVVLPNSKIVSIVDQTEHKGPDFKIETRFGTIDGTAGVQVTMIVNTGPKIESEKKSQEQYLLKKASEIKVSLTCAKNSLQLMIDDSEISTHEQKVIDLFHEINILKKELSDTLGTNTHSIPTITETFTTFLTVSQPTATFNKTILSLIRIQETPINPIQPTRDEKWDVYPINPPISHNVTQHAEAIRKSHDIMVGHQVVTPYFEMKSGKQTTNKYTFCDRTAYFPATVLDKITRESGPAALLQFNEGDPCIVDFKYISSKPNFIENDKVMAWQDMKGYVPAIYIGLVRETERSCIFQVRMIDQGQIVDIEQLKTGFIKIISPEIQFSY